MTSLDEFFLTEEFTDDPVEVDIHETTAGTIAIPTRTGKDSRRPIDPGYVLGWDKWDAAAPTVRWRRRGVVVAWAPNQGSVWVAPSDPRDGEGGYVVVRDVYADPAKNGEEEKTPYRAVGGPGDFRSTERWQRPRMLPRPYLRVDRTFNAEGDVVGDVEWLHADPTCPFPRPWGSTGELVEPGEAVRVEDCYLFDGALHSMSTRPATRDGTRQVPTCFHCMKAKLPD